MGQQPRSFKGLQRKRGIRSSQAAIFILCLSLSLLLGTATPTYAQTPSLSQSPVASAREALIEEIQAQAASDFKAGLPPQPSAVVEWYQKDAQILQLSPGEIAKLYKEEYIRQKTTHQPNLWEQFQPKIGWVAAALFFVLLILRDVLKDWIKSASKTAGNWVYNRFAGSPFFQEIALQRYRTALIDKFQELQIPFRPNRPLQMSEVYVPLKVAGSIGGEEIEARRAVAQYPRLMVTGPPGSGKSMLLKSLALSYAQGKLEAPPKRPIAILLELHRLSDLQRSIEQQLVKVLDRNDFPNATHFVTQALDQGLLLLLLDGLDEVNSGARSQVVQRLKDLLGKYKKCRAIITCRTAVYRQEFAEVADQTLEIVEFSDAQIQRFLGAWQAQMPPEKSIEQLLQTLRDRPRIIALARNPLLLTIISFLYTDTPFVLPHSRAEFYRRSTDILLDQWRGDFNRYRASDKRRLLQNLALYQQDNTTPQQTDRCSINYATVLDQIRQILPSLDLSPDSTKPILVEIVERSGLLLRIDGGERYQFVHLTLQEFFVAAALVEDAEGLIERFQQEPDTWRETAKLWCGLAGNSTALIRAVYEKDAIAGFECLADAEAVDEVLTNKIINTFKEQLAEVATNETLAKALGTVASNSRPRSRAVFQFLVETLENLEEPNLQFCAASALSLTNLPEAAGILAPYYPTFGYALTRMGNLAIPAIVEVADKGNLEALTSLFDIKTPDAAKTLVQLLWHDNQDLAARAAWILTGFLQLPEFEGSLQDCVIAQEHKETESFNWIWKPFEESENSALPTIASRIACLISNAEPKALQSPSLQPDPRLIVPICLIEKIEPLERLDLPTLQPEVNDLAEQSFEDDAQLQDAIDNVLNRRNADASWQLLFSCLPANFQLDLLQRLVNYRLPDRNDWRNLFRPLEYNFKTGWHYQLILFFAVVASIAALAQIFYTVLYSSRSWVNGFAVYSVLILLCFWIRLGLDRLEPNSFINSGLLGPVTFLDKLYRLLRDDLTWHGAEDISRSGLGAGVLISVGSFILVGIEFISHTKTLTLISTSLVGILTFVVILLGIAISMGKATWGTIMTIILFCLLLVLTLAGISFFSHGGPVNFLLPFSVGILAFIVVTLGIGAFFGKVNWGTVIMITLFCLLLVLTLAGISFFPHIETLDFPLLFSVGILAFIVITLGIGAFFGKVNWGTVMTVTLFLVITYITASLLGLIITQDMVNVTVNPALTLGGTSFGVFVGSGIFSRSKAIIGMVAAFSLSIFFAIVGVNPVIFTSNWIAAAIAFTLSALSMVGVGFWVRSQAQKDWGRFLAIFALPFFCWLPITLGFATVGLLRFFPGWQVALFWLVSLGCCTGLWLYGQRRDRLARNPLYGIFEGREGTGNRERGMSNE